MLDYLALGILIFVAITLFYGIIVIHDIPYEIAKHRNHPHQDALHVAGWVSLFTLHVLWPFLWIWATLYREDRGWGFVNKSNSDANTNTDDNTATKKQFSVLQNRIELLEQQLIVQNTALQNLSEQNKTSTDKISKSVPVEEIKDALYDPSDETAEFDLSKFEGEK